MVANVRSLPALWHLRQRRNAVIVCREDPAVPLWWIPAPERISAPSIQSRSALKSEPSQAHPASAPADHRDVSAGSAAGLTARSINCVVKWLLSKSATSVRSRSSITPACW